MLRISSDKNRYISMKHEYIRRLSKVRRELKFISDHRGRKHQDFERKAREIRDKYIRLGEILEVRMIIKHGKGWRSTPEKKHRSWQLQKRCIREIHTLIKSLVDKKRISVLKKQVSRLKMKLQTLRTAIRRYDKRDKKILYYAQMIADYFDLQRSTNELPLRSLKTRGVRAKDVNSDPQARNILIRQIFYKYSADKGIGLVYIARYLKVDRNTVSRGRMSFSRSLKTDKMKLAEWRRFLEFSKEYDPADFRAEEGRAVGRPRKVA